MTRIALSGRRRVKSRELALLTLLAFCGMCRADAPAPEPALGWTARYIMVTSQLEAQRVAIVQTIMQDARSRTPAMLDLLAEELWSIHAQKLPAKQTGFQIIRILTNGPNPARYRSVIDSLDRYIDENGTVEYLQAYKRNYKNEVADQYIPGTIDLEALRRDFLKGALDSQPTMTQAQALADLPTNATMDEMFTRVGRPAYVASHGVAAREAAVVQVRQLWFYYRGIGRVTYDWRRDSGWHQQLVIIDPMAFESRMPYRDQAAVLAQLENETLDPKLKRYAGQPIEQRAGMSGTPYLPGSGSLADQAKKYPSLYPQITLIRGLL